jgi:hypothetical protein
MRKLFLASFIIITILVISCKTRAEKFEGEWIVKDFTITNIDEIIKKQLAMVPDSLKAERKKMIDEDIKTFMDESKKETYKFSRDSFDITRGGRTEKGSWKLSSDGTKLFLMSSQSEKPQADVYEVESVGSKTLNFSFKLSAELSAVYALEKKKETDVKTEKK